MDNVKMGNIKKTRIEYLDFVRSVAVILILLTHYNAVYLYANPVQDSKVILTAYISNIYIGDLGVSLFLIVSGAALMHVYNDKCDLTNFYKKRAISIYPMYWIAFSFFFLYRFYKYKVILPTDIPKSRIFLSLIGMDGYLASFIPNYYICGEWFLGFIILFYMVFPLIRKGVVKKPYLTSIIILFCYVMTILFYSSDKIYIATFLLTRLPEMLFGMLFIRFGKKVPITAFGVSVLVVLLNSILKPTWSQSIQTTYVGIAFFLILTFIYQYVERFNVLSNISRVLSKYSYAIFLVHHVVIQEMVATFNIYSISLLESWLLFACCMLVVAVCARLLYCLHGKCMEIIKSGLSQSLCKPPN